MLIVTQGGVMATLRPRRSRISNPVSLVAVSVKNHRITSVAIACPTPESGALGGTVRGPKLPPPPTCVVTPGTTMGASPRYQLPVVGELLTMPTVSGVEGVVRRHDVPMALSRVESVLAVLVRYL